MCATRSGPGTGFEFEFGFEGIRQALTLELQNERDILEGARSLFAASRSVEHGEWDTFVRGVLAGSDDLLLDGIFYLEPIPGSRSDDGRTASPSEDTPRSPIVRPSDHQTLYAIRYADPRTSGDTQSDLCMDSCPEGRKAAEQARDTGFLTATGRTCSSSISSGRVRRLRLRARLPERLTGPDHQQS